MIKRKANCCSFTSSFVEPEDSCNGIDGTEASEVTLCDSVTVPLDTDLAASDCA